MKKVSFIIPAYNVEETISRTINSILNQENSKIDYEIIIINDGSTDNTQLEIEKYAENKKVKSYQIDNRGVSFARNFATKIASGDYYIFVDGDDYISNTLLKDIEIYIQKNVDLIKWNPIWVNDEGKKLKNIKLNQYMECSGEECFNYLYGNDPLLVGVWNYAIKKEIFEEFPEGKYHEDFAIIPLIVLKAKTMVITSLEEYYYVQTDKSIMRGNEEEKVLKRIKDMLSNYDNLLKNINMLNITKYTKQNLAIFATNSLLALLKDLNGNNEKYMKKELKNRKIYKNIKIRNLKQLIKRIILKIKIMYI